MILTFSDDEENIYNGILEVITNSKSLEWCNTFQDTEIQVEGLRINLAQRSVWINDMIQMTTYVSPAQQEITTDLSLLCDEYIVKEVTAPEGEFDALFDVW